MTVGFGTFRSRNIVFVLYLYLVLGGNLISHYQSYYSMYSTEGLISATNEINVVKFQNFNLNFQRSFVEKRLFIPSVLILRGMKLFLNTSTAALLISLSGDVEINPGPSTQSMRYTEKLQPQSSTKIQHQLLRNSCPSVNCVVLNARSLTSVHKKNDQIFSNMNCMQNFLIAENIDIAFCN